MKSMTGFGRATATLGPLALTIQISSVNRKALDLTLSVPAEWEVLEPKIGESVRKHASRGKVHVDIEVSGGEASQATAWDETALTATLDKLAAYAMKRGIEFQATPQLIWDVVSSQRRAKELPTAEEAQAVVLPALESALKNFTEMRAQEGATLLKDFQARLAILQSHMATVATRAPEVVPVYREVLLKRLREAGLELNVEDERVLKEIALFADRSDITEELTRLRSHLEQFSTLLKSEGEIGRKAEFILQEIGREVHTIGSKANDLAISKNVIELKNELERIREQIANVE